jgi:hypothetical protein
MFKCEKPLTNFQMMYYRYKLKFTKIFGNLKILLSIFLLFLFGFYVFLEININKKFKEQSLEIAKNVSFAIEITKNEMREKLIISLLFAEKELANSKLSKAKLIELAKLLNIFGIDVYNKNGFLLETDANISFSNESSVLNLKECETDLCDGKVCRKTESEILNCKIRRNLMNLAVKDVNIFYELPLTMQAVFMHHKIQKMPAKAMHFYSSKLEKIISVMFIDKEINKTLEEALKINTYLQYIALKDSSGNLITEIGKKEKDNLTIDVTFEKEWNVNIEGKDVVYSYVLSAEFSKKSLKKEVLIFRILFGIIFMLIILIFFILRYSIDGKDEGILILKNLLKRKK